LGEIAKDDAEHIQDRLHEISRRVEFYYDVASDPHVDIVVTLLNSSVWELVTFGEIEGYSKYAGQQIATRPEIFDVSASPILTLKHGESGELKIRQFVSREIAEWIWVQRGRGVALDLSLVRVSFRMLLVGMPIRKFTWWGPIVTVEETMRRR
jgi:hypothetical protein